MAGIPERKYVKVTLGGVSHTVPEEELSYYTRAGYLREGEKPNLANMTPAEIRMAQIAAGEQPTNQVSSLVLANAQIPATDSEISVAVHYGPLDSGVAGPAASAEAVEDAEEVEPVEEKAKPAKVTVKKAGK